MAARENQGFIIGIIVLAILAVILLVTTVFSSMKAYESHDKMVAAIEDSAYQKALSNAYTSKADMLSACLGLEGTSPSEITTFRDLITAQKRNAGDKAGDIQQIADSAQSIYEIYTKDMSFNAAITDGAAANGDADNTYKGTVDKIASALRSQTENAFESSKETKRNQAETEQKVATITNTLGERTKALNQAEEDLAAEKRRNKQSEEKLIAQAKSLQDSKDTLQAEFEDQKSALQNIIATTKNDLKFVVQQNDALKERVNEYERQVFDYPDGEIVQVQSAGSVFIDMGRLDGIRTNMTFAIYDRTATDFEKDRHKATIEVTEVVDEHLAKARVTQEDPLNPILAKDKVLSATFDRGDAVTIALGGFFDIDGDGISDIKRLRRMIKTNGGRIVASHDENGNITGEIDSTTRFFVLGPAPKSGGTRNIVSAVATLKKQADGNSVDVIDLNKLLAWMGVSKRAPIERLDNRIGETSNFQSRSPASSGSSNRGSSTRGSSSR